MMSSVSTDLGPLNQHLASFSYVAGFAPTQHDLAALKEMTSIPSVVAHPHASRWYRHIMSFPEPQRSAWPAEVGGAPTAAAAAAPAAAAATPAPAKQGGGKAAKSAGAAKAKDEDEFDLFGDQTEEEKKAVGDKAKAEKEKQEKSKKKKEVINKSLLVFDITPMSSETNFDEVERLIREIKIEGLDWGENAKRVPIAFGLFKLQMSASIIDDVVNTEEVTEKMLTVGLDETKAKAKLARKDGEDDDDDEEEDDGSLVQTVAIVSFNKL